MRMCNAFSACIHYIQSHFLLCVCVFLDIPAGVDEVPEDPTYLPIIGSGPASNPAASLPGPSAVVAASEPKYVRSVNYYI